MNETFTPSTTPLPDTRAAPMNPSPRIISADTGLKQKPRTQTQTCKIWCQLVP